MGSGERVGVMDDPRVGALDGEHRQSGNLGTVSDEVRGHVFIELIMGE